MSGDELDVEGRGDLDSGEGVELGEPDAKGGSSDADSGKGVEAGESDAEGGSSDADEGVYEADPYADDGVRRQPLFRIVVRECC